MDINHRLRWENVAAGIVEDQEKPKSQPLSLFVPEKEENKLIFTAGTSFALTNQEQPIQTLNYSEQIEAHELCKRNYIVNSPLSLRYTSITFSERVMFRTLIDLERDNLSNAWLELPSANEPLEEEPHGPICDDSDPEIDYFFKTYDQRYLKADAFPRPQLAFDVISDVLDDIKAVENGLIYLERDPYVANSREMTAKYEQFKEEFPEYSHCKTEFSSIMPPVGELPIETQQIVQETASETDIKQTPIVESTIQRIQCRAGLEQWRGFDREIDAFPKYSFK